MPLRQTREDPLSQPSARSVENSRGKRKVRSCIEVIEGYFLGQAVRFLIQLGVISEPTRAISISQLHTERGLDPSLTLAVLEFVVETSDLLQRRERGVYGLSPQYADHPIKLFRLVKFLGAYGAAFNDLSGTLKDARSGHDSIDHKALSLAFGLLEGQPVGPLLDMIRERRVNVLCEVGCGRAPILRALAKRCADIRGWAVDSDRDMVSSANSVVRAEGLSDRIEVKLGDARRLRESLSDRDIGSVQAVVVRSLINEFFGYGQSTCRELLEGFKLLFPGRLLFVADYYGKLTHCENIPAKLRHTLLQDLVQAVSGQGVPPSSLRMWSQLYEAAGLTLIDSCDGGVAGVESFVHVVRLS